MKRNGDLTGVGCVGILLLSALAIALSVVLNGWALSTLWGWFIVPLFGLPALTIPYALGISTIVSFLAPNTTRRDSDDKSMSYEELFAEVFTLAIGRPAFAVLMGWIILQFI